MIKPEARTFIGEIISTLERYKLSIRNLKMIKLQALTAVQFLNHRNSEESITGEMENLTSGPVVVMEVMGETAFEQLKHICGPDNFEEAKGQNPLSLRAMYGYDNIRNAVMISKDLSINQQDLEFFFPRANDRLKVHAKFSKSTLCIIKPHAVKEYLIGGILKMITENGFTITAMKMLQLSRSQCDTFYEIYKGIVDDYMSMVSHLASGMCLALEVQGCDDETQPKFRALCGPADVEVGKILRPKTIRVLFGIDKTLNAVHCTDLREDTMLELEYIFKELQ